MNTQKTTRLLKRLMQICDQGALGFHYSAERARSKDLALILLSLADNCWQGKFELQKYLGGALFPRNSATSVLRRAKLTLRILFAENVDLTILRECARMEETAVSEYGDAIQKPLPPPIRELLERQYRGAQCNARRIHDLLVLQQVIGPTISHPKQRVAKTRDSNALTLQAKV